MNTSISTLRRLVSYNSVSKEPIIPIASYLAEEAEQIGFKVDLYETEPGKVNVVAHIGPNEPDGLALSGHMDVVPVEGQAWSRDPFLLHQDGDLLYGRGTCDMKGFIAVAYSALRRLPASKLRKGISLVWTHDEEIGCVGAQNLCSTLSKKQLSLPRSMLIGEPTSSNICRMHGGHSTLRISFQGEPAHSSKPHLGHSAISAAVQAVQKLEELQLLFTTNPCPYPELNDCCSLINVAQIHGGEAVNIIPEHCSILVGIRPMPGTDFTALMKQIQFVLQEVSVQKSIEIEHSLLQHAPAMLTPVGTKLEQELHQICPKAESIGVPFATDGGCFQEFGCLPIVFGPGSINQAHKADEFISITELLSYEKRLYDLISKWCL